MKYLTQNEILSWNNRNFILQNRLRKDLKLNYRFDYQNGNSIVIAHDTNDYLNPVNKKLGAVTEEQIRICNNVGIKYNFCFSVVKSHNQDFFNLLDRLFKNKIDSKYLYDVDTTKPIVFDKDVLSSSKEMDFNIGDREFKRYHYDFSGNLFSIMAYVSYLEDAINYFNLLYGYDEDSKEVNLVEYPIGTIVTKTDDNTKDYLVIDYNYNKQVSDTDKFYISYLTAEILYTNKPVIKYGEVSEFREYEICISRNGRIEQILN